MAEPIIPMPTKKETQSKVPPVVEQPKQQITPKDPVQNPDKPGTIPFKFSKDGSILVSKEFLEVNRDNIKAEAQKAGYDSPAEYLKSVVTGAVGKTGKWTGKTVGEAERLLWTPEQESKAAMIAKKHGMTPNEFKAIIAHESAGTMNPKVVNQIGATGLVQFVPTTAASYLLMEQRAAAVANAKTPEEKAAAEKNNPLFWQLSKENQKKAAEWGQRTMATLPVERQLDLADLYITDRANGKRGFENVYTAIFAGNPDVKEFKQGTAAYKYNKGLDKDKDGRITRDEWTQPVENKIKGVKKGNKLPEVSDEELEQMKDRASKVLQLAMPSTKREDIQTATTVVPAKITMPGSREQTEMASRDAGGLYWPQGSKEGEQVWVTGSLPKPSATGVLAHEYGHAMGLEDIGKGLPAPAQPGLMHWQGDEAGLTEGWSEVVQAAAETGGDVLDEEQSKREEDLYANVPSFLQGPLKSLVGVEQVKPSESFDYETMEQTSGVSPIAQEEWSSLKKKK